MIQANELRIENLVLSPLGWLGKVYNVSPQFVTLANDNLEPYVFGIDLIDPIPITPEWLERLGFDDVIEDFGNCNINYIFRANPRYWIQYHVDVKQFIFYEYSIGIEKVISHVHQIQNLYHSLTGEELKAK